MTDTKISKDEMTTALSAFWNSDSRYDSHYKDFVFVFGSVCEMADHKQVGWVSEISEFGYSRIEMAYKELVFFGWGSEDDDTF